MYRSKLARHSRGFSLIESLVSISFLGIALVGIAQSMRTSFMTSKRVARESIGLELARAKMEELAATPTANLLAALSGTENLTVNTVKFTRNTTVVVNADNSRTVTVQVTGTAGTGGNFTIVQTLAELGGT